MQSAINPELASALLAGMGVSSLPSRVETEDLRGAPFWAVDLPDVHTPEDAFRIGRMCTGNFMLEVATVDPTGITTINSGPVSRNGSKAKGGFIGGDNLALIARREYTPKAGLVGSTVTPAVVTIRRRTPQEIQDLYLACPDANSTNTFLHALLSRDDPRTMRTNKANGSTLVRACMLEANVGFTDFAIENDLIVIGRCLSTFPSMFYSFKSDDPLEMKRWAITAEDLRELDDRHPYGHYTSPLTGRGDSTNHELLRMHFDGALSDEMVALTRSRGYASPLSTQ